MLLQCVSKCPTAHHCPHLFGERTPMESEARALRASLSESRRSRTLWACRWDSSSVGARDRTLCQYSPGDEGHRREAERKRRERDSYLVIQYADTQSDLQYMI